MDRRGWLIAVLLALSAAGCGPGHGMQLGRVKGTVTYRGEPVRYGFITFQPDDTRGTVGPPAMSTISGSGAYALTTQDPDDGTVVGSHRVAIIPLDPNPVDAVEAIDPKADPKAFMATKGQPRRPPAASKDGPTFTSRDGKVYRVLGPESLGNPNTSGIAVEVGRGSNRLDFAIQEDGRVVVGD
ncbi:hypothetical protein [Tautonia plasticadhaerens]|uniref:Carboxypeptidase regulatory-like domain-containing protein n=1 Tax=Tautonia plasticadhaerens TaxID=2527974 RepID=A0A518H1E1_9BACT|nr:hypothetical protein [Tautonia plasticadhaerens]QDV34659.1 hypothetical protein ElP_25510 [Tautonia plasticadhaerens]